MQLLEISHAVSVALGVAGAACVARGAAVLGQALWIPANLLWIHWCVTMSDWWGAGLFGVYLGLAIAGVARARVRR
jgi:hypothetical protein